MPPGIGTLNIINKKEREAAIPSIGANSLFSFNCAFTFVIDSPTTGAAATAKTAQDAGLK